MAGMRSWLLLVLSLEGVFVVASQQPPQFAPPQLQRQPGPRDYQPQVPNLAGSVASLRRAVRSSGVLGTHQPPVAAAPTNGSSASEGGSAANSATFVVQPVAIAPVVAAATVPPLAPPRSAPPPFFARQQLAAATPPAGRAPPSPRLDASSEDQVPLPLLDEVRKETARLESQMRALAQQHIRQFAPVTPAGQLKLQGLVSAFHKIPGVSGAGMSLAQNPNFIDNVLDGLRGTGLLWGFYEFLGDEEVDAHQVLLQSSGDKSRVNMFKGVGLFFFANLMLIPLVLAEFHEFMNANEFFPGLAMGEEVEEEELPEPEVQTEHKDPNAVVDMALKVKEFVGKLSGPATSVLQTLTKSCHDLVTFQESKTQPYSKLAFVWTAFILAWAAQMALLSATLFSMQDASSTSKGAASQVPNLA